MGNVIPNVRSNVFSNVLNNVNPQCPPYGDLIDATDPDLLSAWYMIDDPSGTVQDIKEVNNGSTVGTLAQGADALGSYLSYDGSTGYVRLTDSATFDFGTGDFTIAGWFRQAVGGTTQHLYDQRDSGSDGIRIGLNASNILFFTLNATAEFLSVPTTQGGIYRWSIQRSGTAFSMYTNGAPGDSDTSSAAIDTTTNPAIGTRNFSSASNFFNGDMWTVEIYGAAKGAAWEAARYANGIARL